MYTDSLGWLVVRPPRVLTTKGSHVGVYSSAAASHEARVDIPAARNEDDLGASKTYSLTFKEFAEPGPGLVE